MSGKRDYKAVDGSFSTKANHTGQDPDDWSSGSIVPPIHATTAFKQIYPDKNRGFFYSRLANPSRSVLERCLAGLEDAEHCLVFSSGISALDAVCFLLEKDDHIVSAEPKYRGSYDQMKHLAKIGINHTIVDSRILENVRQEIQPNTKIVFLENPSNPFTWITDLPKLSKLIKEINPNIVLVVDNTILTPYFQKPLKLGADIVIYSLSKYMNGHADVTMGAAVMNREDLYEKLKDYQIDKGSVPSPFDCFLAHRGLKTLGLRMERHMKNALEVARFLEKHRFVEKVLYPGLESHPQHSLAKELFSGTSGLMSFYLKGGPKEMLVFFESTKIVKFFPTFGDTQSTMCDGVTLFGKAISKEEMDQMGVKENLIRLSIGIEDAHDLINDLDQALNKLSIFEQGANF